MMDSAVILAGLQLLVMFALARRAWAAETERNDYKARYEALLTAGAEKDDE